MSKKHFEALAKAVWNNRNMDSLTPEQVAKMLADVCAQFNGMFDRDRFIAACLAER